MSNIYKHVKDEDFLKEVDFILKTVEKSLDKIEDTIHSNVIDPFSALFDAASQNITYKEWLEQEKNRQLQKTLQNSIGYFHQNILGLVKGWNNPGSGGGYDVENKRKKIIAEVKNKHNTFNSSSADATYEKLAKFIDGEKKGYVAYVVIVLPKNQNVFDKPFVPSGKKEREDIRIVDGVTFYKMATGNKNALKELFESVPVAVEKIRGKKSSKTKVKDFNDLFIKAYGE